jgi:hypothetical protein
MRMHNVQMINRKVRLMVGTSMGVAAFASAAGAEELPGLRSGLWEFKRTVEGASADGTAQTLVNQKCTDPTADMKKGHETLTKSGCQFSPLTKSGDTYSFTADCQIQGVHAQSHSIITVESESAYRVEVNSGQGAHARKEVLVAKRIGECPK